MQNKLEIAIDEQTSNYIESLGYEVDSRKNLISFMLDRNMDTTTNAFKNYSNEYSNFAAQFELAKKELENTHMPKEWVGHECKWALEYSNHLMVIEKLCNC